MQTDFFKVATISSYVFLFGIEHDQLFKGDITMLQLYIMIKNTKQLPSPPKQWPSPPKQWPSPPKQWPSPPKQWPSPP